MSGGVDPKIGAERLGHSPIVITLDTYTHALPDMQQAATAQLEGILFNKPVA